MSDEGAAAGLGTGLAAPPTGWLVDPSGRFSYRYFDGKQFTPWVRAHDGRTVQDLLPGSQSVPQTPGMSVPTSSAPSEPPPSPTGLPPTPPSQRALGERSAPSNSGRHAGDAVLQFLSKVTLNSWADKQLAEAFWLDRLTAIAHEHPNDPRALTWLGFRLREFERTRKRIRSSTVPVSVAGLVLRPIVRPVLSAAAGAISSGDGTPASTRVLSRAWELLNARIRSNSASSADLCLLARLHHAAGDLDSAWLVIDAASKADQTRSEISYIAAEVLYDLVRADWSWQWALRAWNQGCTLAGALLRPDTADRRRKLLTERAAPLTGVTAVSFWQHKAWYFDGADAGQLAHYFGPSPLTVRAPEGASP